MTNCICLTRAFFGGCCNGFNFLQSNSNCNYFEWVNEEECKGEGGESEFEAGVRKRFEEEEVCLEKEKLILDLIKKNEKLKRKLQKEKNLANCCNFYLYYRGHSIVFVVMFLFKFNYN